MNQDEISVELHAALSAKDGARLLKLSERLLALEIGSRPYESGYLIRGMAYELGGGGLLKDLQRAEANYRQSAVRTPDSIPFLYLARVLLEQGPSRREEVLRCIDEAKRLRMVPEVHLAYARYYEDGGSSEDFCEARRHYRRAAICGRYCGYFGYSRVLRTQGLNELAVLVDVLRVLLAPINLLLFGRATRRGL